MNVWHQGESWGREAPLFAREVLAEAIVRFLSPFLTEPAYLPYLSLHQLNYHHLPALVIP